MTDHYYTKKPQVESNPQEWNSILKGMTFCFKTDAGVFSKKEVDFGSRLLIESFVADENVVGPILDVGCGYGPIGLSIAKTNPTRTIHMIDVNERAVSLAKNNAQLNKIENVKIYESFIFHQVTENEFSAVISNPPIRAGKAIVHEILEKSFEKLTIGGQLWVVIQKKQGALSSAAKMKAVFGNVEVVMKKKGYFIIKSKKLE